MFAWLLRRLRVRGSDDTPRVPPHACGFCAAAPMHTPQLAPCGCVFCYYCVAAACHASGRPRCPRCVARLELGTRCPADLIPQPPPTPAAAPAVAPAAASTGGVHGGEAVEVVPIATEDAPLQGSSSQEIDVEGTSHARVDGEGEGRGDEGDGEATEGAADIGFRRADGGVTWHSE